MREMKDSGIEWAGQIPAEWKVEKNKRLFFEVNNKCLETDSYTLLSVSEYYGVAPRAEKIKDGDFETRAESLDGYKICHKNDIVMNIMLAWKRATARTSYDGIVSPAYCVYRGKDIETRYYHYVFRTEGCADYFKRHSTGIIDSRLRLYPESFFNLNSPVPPIIEQKQIADFLDNRCSEIDAISADIQKEIETLAQYKRSVITEAVTKGLNPDAEMKDSGVPWIGMMPANWTCIKGKYILKYMQKPVKPDDGVITCFRDGEVTLRSNRREDGFTMADKEIGYQGIDAGDLVVHGMDGFAGAIGISDSRGKASPVLNVLNSRQNKKYIMYYLRSMAYGDVFAALATGIRVRSCDLRWNKLSVLLYPVPPLEEQAGIVQYIEDTLNKVNGVISEKKQQLTVIDSYKKSLIYEYVTGKKEAL